jgi:hypothetical protein
MLIHNTFRKDLLIHSYEHDNQWKVYDNDYLQAMKRQVKQQLINQFGSIHGKKIMIDRPIVLRHQIPTMMAVWELGGIVVINDLHYLLQQNPIYQDFYSAIDLCFVGLNDIRLNNVDQILTVFSDRLYEIDYSELPNFGLITDDPVIATGNDLALMVATSGTTKAPTQVYYTHSEVLLAMEANKITYDYKDDEHVLHVKAFHHGGLCVNYFLPTLSVCQHHYYKNLNSNIDKDAINIASEMPITRIMFPWQISQTIVDELKTQKNINKLTLHSTHTMQNTQQIDQLFATGQVERIIILFGCRELPAIFFMQDLLDTTWSTECVNWSPSIFKTTPSNFWQIEVFEDGLGVKASYMDDFYIPGDYFHQLPNGDWQWTGRNTQIKRNGIIVNPDVITTVLDRAFPSLDKLIVPDYQHKKIYGFVFNSADTELIDKFNQVIITTIDSQHQLDLVMCLPKKDIIGANKGTSWSPLRFLARKQLNIDGAG